MSRDSTYPDEPAGPFPEPPVTFEDGEGREIEVRAYPMGHAIPGELVAMYDAFDPADRAQGIPPSGETRIRRWLETVFEEGFNAVAWHGDRVAGHATLVPDGGDEADEEDDDTYELAIFVLQAYQRAGIGTRLLEALLGYGAANGARKVWLTVERWNRPAINLYEKVGFQVAASASFELEMGLRLDPDRQRELGPR